jgi:hypothetical protein
MEALRRALLQHSRRLHSSSSSSTPSELEALVKKMAEDVETTRTYTGLTALYTGLIMFFTAARGKR